MSQQNTNCVKCGKPKEKGAVECPFCGVIYAKAEAALARKNGIETVPIVQEKEEPPTKIRFKYTNSGGEKTERTVTAVSRFRYDGRSYIIGFCTLREERRTFRADRIEGEIINARTGEIITVNDLIEGHPPVDWEGASNHKTEKNNSNLTSCRACGREISVNAESCPSCGEPLKPVRKTPAAAPTKSASGCGTLILIVIVLSVIGSFFDDDEDKLKPPKKKTEQVQEDPNCRFDLQCWGDKHIFSAGVYCAEPVEKLAKYSHKWTDGVLETKFSRFRWLDKTAGTMTYIGDKIQFQNGFGAWQNYTYECDINPESKQVLEVRAFAGRM